ncbi:MAG: hypothetical protein ACK4IS_07380 [Erythrobacter sp.]
MWLVYPSEAEAEAAQELIWAAVKPPAEIRDGVPVPERITQRWAVPRLAAEGWAIAAPPQAVPGLGGILLGEVAFPELEEEQP